MSELNSHNSRVDKK